MSIVFIQESLQMTSSSSVQTLCPYVVEKKKRLIFETKQNFLEFIMYYVTTYELNSQYFYKHFKKSHKKCK